MKVFKVSTTVISMPYEIKFEEKPSAKLARNKLRAHFVTAGQPEYVPFILLSNHFLRIPDKKSLDDFVTIMEKHPKNEI